MLAKMWKKVLLAICIIACIYNVMSKIVNRNSLETNLKSVNDGNTIWDSIKTNSVTSNSSDKIEGVKNSSSNVSNTSSENTIKSEKINENEIENINENKDDSGQDVMKYSDYTIIMDIE